MAKKRKSAKSSLQLESASTHGQFGSKLNIRTYEDVADSEDEFHINRDKILLDEGPARKRQRRIQEAEELLEPSDEEVFAAPDEVSDFEEGESSDEGNDASPDHPSRKDAEAEEYSDTESKEAEEDADTTGWGTSKKDYYDADAIETEADALEEEQEAIRLQKKQLQRMTEADFGFDETEWLNPGKGGKDVDSEEEGVVREILPPLEITESMSSEERNKILTTRYPEFGPLSREFLNLQPLHEQFRLDSTAAQTLANSRRESTNDMFQGMPIATIKWTALSAYLAALSMYFAIFTSGPKDSNDRGTAIPPTKLRDHSIMNSLVQCRNLWEKVKDITVPELVTETLIPDATVNQVVEESRKLEQAVKGARSLNGGTVVKQKKKRKSKAERAALKALVATKAERAERVRRTEKDLAKLFAITSKNPTTPQSALKPQAANEDDSDFGEETTLTLHEAAEKAKRKKTLQFYTSQLAQKANKRNTAGRDAGGDADIPYRERFKDRQARLNTEAEARGKKTKDILGDRLGEESDEEDRRAAKEVREANDDGDYYDFIAAQTRKKKADKEAFAAAKREAASQGATVRPVEEIGPGGKRAITYTIEKNKGLTPKRKKEVRNPRVKKRKKFEEKKKKLGSIRQVYKGGEGRGGYGGELTGIKSNLVKSIKL